MASDAPTIAPRASSCRSNQERRRLRRNPGIRHLLRPDSTADRAGHRIVVKPRTGAAGPQRRKTLSGPHHVTPSDRAQDSGPLCSMSLVTRSALGSLRKVCAQFPCCAVCGPSNSDLPVPSMSCHPPESGSGGSVTWTNTLWPTIGAAHEGCEAQPVVAFDENVAIERLMSRAWRGPAGTCSLPPVCRPAGIFPRAAQEQAHEVTGRRRAGRGAQ